MRGAELPGGTEPGDATGRWPLAAQREREDRRYGAWRPPWCRCKFGTTSDEFPKGAVASVTSLGGFAGGLGGILFSAKLPGFVIGHFGSYMPMFAIMGSLHPIALLVMSQLSRRKRRRVAAPV